MDSIFPGSYILSNDAIQELWPEVLISFDANVLLSLYSYSLENRGNLLNAMQQISERENLWLTHQVLLEFFRNRMDQIRRQDTRAGSLAKHFQKLCEAVKDTIGDDDHHADVDLKQVQKIAEDARQRADKLLAHENRKRIDPLDDVVLKRLTDIVGTAYGAPPKSEILKKREGEWEGRRPAQTPPGFADGKKADEGIGDYLIWCELLDLAVEKQRPIIFVTNDRKGDWWELYEADSLKKVPIAPRVELVNEMHDIAGVRYHQMLPRDFINSELQGAVSPKAAEELSRAPLEDPYEQPELRDPYAGISAGRSFDRPVDIRDLTGESLLYRAMAEESAARANVEVVERLLRTASGEDSIQRAMNQPLDDLIRRFSQGL